MQLFFLGGLKVKPLGSCSENSSILGTNEMFGLKDGCLGGYGSDI